MLSKVNDFLLLTGTRRISLAALSISAVASGALNIALVSLVGETLRHASQVDLPWHFWQFLLGVLLYLLVLGYLQISVVRISELAAAAVRRRFAEQLFRAPLIDSERVSHHLKQAVMGRDANIVAAALSSLIAVIASVVTVIGGLVYLFMLSAQAAAAVCIVIVATVVLYQIYLNRLSKPLGRAFEINDEFFGFSEDLIRGAKELKLDSRFSVRFMHDDLFSSLDRATSALIDVKVRQQNAGLVSAIAFFLLIGVTAFVHRIYGGFDPALAMSFVLTLLFLNMPIQNAIMRLPVLGEAMVALRRIRELQGRLGREAEQRKPRGGAAFPADWRHLELRHVGFRYDADGDHRFGLRDVGLVVERGDLVFIVGGNGSGKTTLSKIIMGLYVPTNGEILLDGQPVSDDFPAYRDQFNAVFSDAYLFARDPAALDTGSRWRFDGLVRELKLAPRMQRNGRLDVKALSQGQCKRLALALALSEDKPIHFFDEWTADQDPEFRAYFYETFLPRLRAEGKTIFVISHDDRFHHRADLLVRMDAGRIHSVERNGSPRPEQGRGASDVYPVRDDERAPNIE
ncbi:cyclic peptide export ABC transporter [Burkholderia sp. FERM BP-3421]|uniref:cyclic peptide export ABC transporter n=1 Tax=Burkholderia sp. FERM BP-3421 TaxID=1494466 RepID=UPI002361089D|nr:cyclic peptide export ABC transporter [Burkholderia sp. FERM BP-3421]WDD92411.1 cyclic peptide export ABC transporter [Burkholderia sp. FERM BP-3421]